MGEPSVEDLKRRAMKAGEALKEVKVPGFDVNVIDSGIVTKITVSKDGDAVAIFVDLMGSDPACNFCRMINWALWSKVLLAMEDKLLTLGFTEVYFFDARTGFEVIKLENLRDTRSKLK